MLATVAFAVLPVRIKELVYGNVQQGDDLVKGIQTWMLTPVFKIHDRAVGVRSYKMSRSNVQKILYKNVQLVCLS